MTSAKECAAGPTRKEASKTLNSTLAQPDVCQYQPGQGQSAAVVGSMACAMTATPMAFCPVGAGDQEFLEVKQLAQDFITNENVPACHVNAGMLCDATLAFDKRGALAFSMLTTWIDELASMRSAPDCVLWSIKPEQYFVQTGNYPQKPGSSSNSGAAPNFVVSTALLLLASFTLII